jgi:hypothetical protein
MAADADQQRDGMVWPAAALVVTQVVHAATPTKGEVDSEGPLGLIFGLIFLGCSVAALVGLIQHRPYGRPLAARIGLVVSVGFIAYHAVPWHGWFTNPYFGEPVGPKAWATVVVSVASGFWCAYEGREALRARASATRAPA